MSKRRNRERKKPANKTELKFLIRTLLKIQNVRA